MPGGVQHIEDVIDSLVWEGWPREQVTEAVHDVAGYDPDDLIGPAGVADVIARLWEMEEAR